MDFWTGWGLAFIVIAAWAVVSVATVAFLVWAVVSSVSPRKSRRSDVP